MKQETIDQLRGMDFALFSISSGWDRCLHIETGPQRGHDNYRGLCGYEYRTYNARQPAISYYAGKWSGKPWRWMCKRCLRIALRAEMTKEENDEPLANR